MTPIELTAALYIAMAVWFDAGEIVDTQIIDPKPMSFDQCRMVTQRVDGDGAVGVCVDAGLFHSS